MRVLLDTNACSALFRGHHALTDRVRHAEQVLISAIVAGEVLFGFRHGSRYEANAKQFERFLANPYVAFLPVTLVTADRYARISASLRRRGRPLPTNDIWIAAHAMESGADLLSFDQHFAHVDGLAWVYPEGAE